jgi:hypothetical protein
VFPDAILILLFAMASNIPTAVRVMLMDALEIKIARLVLAILKQPKVFAGENTSLARESTARQLLVWEQKVAEETGRKWRPREVKSYKVFKVYKVKRERKLKSALFSSIKTNFPVHLRLA